MPLPAVLKSPAAGVRQRQPQLFKTATTTTTSGRGQSGKAQRVLVQWILLVMVLFAAVAYGIFAYVFLQQQQQQSHSVAVAVVKESREHERQPPVASATPRSPFCDFRKYPPHRYYHLPASKQPDFLLQTDYIYGTWPQLIPTLSSPTSSSASASSTEKLCVDQSAWHNHNNQKNNNKHRNSKDLDLDILPFADGTNPSIITRFRYETLVSPEHQVSLPPSVQYIATVCMTNSQCHWKDSAQEMKEGRINPQRQPDTVRTMLLLLDVHFQTVQQATIYLKLDARYGTSKRHGIDPINKNNDSKNDKQQQQHLPALDDARLFVHHGQLWISYREGKLFGFEAQVLNPVHIVPPSSVGGDSHTHVNDHNASWSVHLLASETTSFCCGRNMALMEPLTLSVSSNENDKNNNNNSHSAADAPVLQSLTWVDPVTVITIDTTTHMELAQRKKKDVFVKAKRRLLEQSDLPDESNFGSLVNNPATLAEHHALFESMTSTRQHQQQHRQLAEAPLAKKESHIHGTNAFMVYLKDRHEYLGVAHFHRPNDRTRNPYARFGHHYTHCFYTITAEPPYRLASLSPEFLLPSAVDGHAMDGEIIQFVSGVEVAYGVVDRVILAYGINDCEAAAVTLDYKIVTQQWLKPVKEGKEVVDYMKPLDRSTLPANKN